MPEAGHLNSMIIWGHVVMYSMSLIAHLIGVRAGKPMLHITTWPWMLMLSRQPAEGIVKTWTLRGAKVVRRTLQFWALSCPTALQAVRLGPSWLPPWRHWHCCALPTRPGKQPAIAYRLECLSACTWQKTLDKMSVSLPLPSSARQALRSACHGRLLVPTPAAGRQHSSCRPAGRHCLVP